MWNTLLYVCQICKSIIQLMKVEGAGTSNGSFVSIADREKYVYLYKRLKRLRTRGAHRRFWGNLIPPEKNVWLFLRIWDMLWHARAHTNSQIKIICKCLLVCPWKYYLFVRYLFLHLDFWDFHFTKGTSAMYIVLAK